MNTTQPLNKPIATAEHSRALYALDAAEHSIYQTFAEAGKAITNAEHNLRSAVKEDWAAWNARA